jgi:predicted transcriptional regulator
MTKEQLEALFDQIRALPPEKLEELAEIVEWMDPNADFFDIPPEAEAGIARGLAAAEAGEFVSEEEMAEFFAKIREGRR